MTVSSDEPTDALPLGSRWVVRKFGGTSVASRARWDQIERVISERPEERQLLVCSAVSGMTNALEKLIREIDSGCNPAASLAVIGDTHRRLAESLELDPALPALDELLASLAAEAQAPGPVTPARRARILSHGEMMSTRLGAAFLSARGVPTTWIDARSVLTSERELVERPERYLSARCDFSYDPEARARLDAIDTPVVITQGFLASSPEGETVLLGRGGSDTSASYLAAVIRAARIEIWTDVPGVFTANPHQIRGARLVRRLGYDEAEALGALGAKVLHPRCIEPARESGIPLQIGWTARPDVEGTKISGARSSRGAKSVSARGNLYLITMRRPSSWQPVGFMADVASVFARRGLSMDLLSSSPSEIRATVDLAAFPSAKDELDAFVTELETVCSPRVVAPVACVSVIGRRVSAEMAGHHAFTRLADEAVHLITHAANDSHLSVVVDEAIADELTGELHQALFAHGEEPETWMGPTWAELDAAVPTPSQTPETKTVSA